VYAACPPPLPSPPLVRSYPTSSAVEGAALEVVPDLKCCRGGSTRTRALYAHSKNVCTRPALPPCPRTALGHELCTHILWKCVRGLPSRAVDTTALVVGYDLKCRRLGHTWTRPAHTHLEGPGRLGHTRARPAPSSPTSLSPKGVYARGPRAERRALPKQDTHTYIHTLHDIT
jgi:hypothetical protein